MITWSKAYVMGEVLYFAYNEKNEKVGYLELVQLGAHRHWCWYQTPNFWMSPGCLDCVRDKQKKLFKDRKKVK